MGFLFQTTRRIHFGTGKIKTLPDEIARLGTKRIVIVSDPGLLKAGLVDKTKTLLANLADNIAIFTDIESDPSIETALRCRDALVDCKADMVIGLGGGSAMDVAKMGSILATSNQAVDSMFGIELVQKPGLPLVLIPTTAGTGSEVTHIAILSDNKEHLKRGVVSRYLFPQVAIVDPELSLGVPAAVTAASGMDALLHAVEAFTSKNASDITDTLARRAMQLISANLRAAFADGSNLSARTGMLEGSMLAGMAFANAGVTAVHAFAYPIGAEFHIPHGVANSIMMGPVLAFNLIGNLEKFAEASRHVGGVPANGSLKAQAESLVSAMKILADDINIPKHLADYGVREEHLPGLADGVLKVTRLLANNPRTLSREDAIRIYREVL